MMQIAMNVEAAKLKRRDHSSQECRENTGVNPQRMEGVSRVNMPKIVESYRSCRYGAKAYGGDRIIRI